MLVKKILLEILGLFKKVKRYPCILWDGKTMSYLDLSNEEISSMKKENKNLVITKKEEL